MDVGMCITGVMTVIMCIGAIGAIGATGATTPPPGAMRIPCISKMAVAQHQTHGAGASAEAASCADQLLLLDLPDESLAHDNGPSNDAGTTRSIGPDDAEAADARTEMPDTLTFAFGTKCRSRSE